MNLWALIPLIGFAFLTVILALLTPKRQQAVNKFLSFYVFSSVICCLLVTLLLFSNSASADFLSLIYGLFLALLPLTVGLYYQFVRVFLTKKAGKEAWVCYLGSLIVLIAALTGNVVKDAYFTGNTLYTDTSYWGPAVAVVTAPFLVAALLLLSKRYLRSIDPAYKNRTLTLIFGLVVLFLIGGIAIFAPPLKLLPITVAIVVNALVVTYAVIKIDLPDVRLLFRKILTAFIFSVLFLGLTVGLFEVYQAFFAAIPLWVALLMLLLTYVIVFLLAFKLLRIIDYVLDNFVYKKHAVYTRASAGFHTKMRHLLDLDEVTQEIFWAVTGVTNIDFAGLILYDKQTRKYDNLFFYSKENPNSLETEFKKITFNLSSPVVKLATKTDYPLFVRLLKAADESAQPLGAEKEMLERAGAAYLFPLKSRSRLIGMLALGKVNNKKTLTLQEIDFLNSITQIAGVVIENAQLYAHFITQANTDELTGLYNHRHFNDRLYQEIARNARLDGTFSIIMMDIDFFKNCNDTYGHLVGDGVLRKVGEYIDISIRDMDSSFRYGGDEFIVILPDTGAENAYKVAERIRKTIELKSKEETVPITASLGIANWPDNGITEAQIMRAADKALYMAKQLGRNTTFVLSPDVSDTAEKDLPLNISPEPRTLTTIYAMAASIDRKTEHSHHHSRNVSDYAVAIAKSMNLPAEKIESIRSAGLLHDIGKVGLPGNVLNRDTILTDSEAEMVQKHPKVGAEILKHVVDLINCIPSVLHHHENYDGSGYHTGLKGEEIPLGARILSVANTYETIRSALESDKQFTVDNLINELKKKAGTKLDPFIVETLIEVVRKQGVNFRPDGVEKQTRSLPYDTDAG
ncbi:MAG: diguanylate cyclase [Dehalococcoidales bacterium]